MDHKETYKPLINFPLIMCGVVRNCRRFSNPSLIVFTLDCSRQRESALNWLRKLASSINDDTKNSLVQTRIVNSRDFIQNWGNHHSHVFDREKNFNQRWRETYFSPVSRMNLMTTRVGRVRNFVINDLTYADDELEKI